MTHRITARPARGGGAAPQVDDSADTIARFIEDAAHSPGGHAAGVAFPRTEADVAALVRAHGAVLPVGAQSSLTGGATPAGDLVLSFARMNRVLDIGPDRVRVEPGLTLASLQKALDPHGLYYPPVPTFTGASIGGTIATNAAGAATFKYGSTRAWIEALTVVLASGEAIDLVRGRVAAHRDGYFEIALHGGVLRVPVPGYRMPDVAKRSAGYHAEPGMDLVDLFVGSEGTLGVVTDATLRIVPRASASCTAYVPLISETEAFRLTAALRDAARLAWTSGGREGVDIPAIEYLDGRSLSLVPDRLLARAGLRRGAERPVALLVRLELPPDTTASQAFQQIAAADGRAASPLGRFCALLARYDAFDATEIALPGDATRAARFDEVREAVPSAVNELVGLARRTVDPGMEKVAGDMIVPFEALEAMVAAAREAFGRRGLDLAIWGHVSDGNLHPNLVPRSAVEVAAGKEAILELGREVTRLGGCPLAEHGVGRSAVKQALLCQLYGEAGVEEMRAVKRALDPGWKLAPGVLFGKGGV